MIYSINDKIRNIISNAKTMSSIVIYLEQIDPNIKEQIIKLAIIDFYKINHILMQYNERDNYNLKDYELEEIYEQSEDDYRILSLLVNSVATFDRLDIISKIILFEELTEEENNKLNEFINLHLLDNIIYKFNYDLDDFKEYYIDYLTKNSKMANRWDRASIFITNKMIDLSEIDLNKYKKFMLNMIREYYIWKKFIFDHDGGYLLNPDDFIYLKIIENHELDNILNEIKEDYDFMNTIVGEYLHYTTSKPEIDRTLVTKYYEEKINKQIQKKLEIKS